MQAAINAAATDLPADLPTLPTFRKSNPGGRAGADPGADVQDLPPSDIYDAADTVIAQRISQVDGVAEVTVAGAEQPAIRVRVNPMRLAAIGLSIEDVRPAIANANALAPLGIIDGASRPSPSRSTTSCARSTTTRASSSRRRTATSCASSDVADVEQARATAARRPCSTASRRSC